MFGPGRHFPPAELREWERGERLDPEYQLSAKPPFPAQPSPSPRPRPKSQSAFLQRKGGGNDGRRGGVMGGGGGSDGRRGRGGGRQGGRERETQRGTWAWGWPGSPPKAFLSGHPKGTSVLGVVTQRGRGSHNGPCRALPLLRYSVLGCSLKRVLEGQPNGGDKTRSSGVSKDSGG